MLFSVCNGAHRNTDRYYCNPPPSSNMHTLWNKDTSVFIQSIAWNLFMYSKIFLKKLLEKLVAYIFSILSRIIDQFERNWCQKKRTVVDYKLL